MRQRHLIELDQLWNGLGRHGLEAAFAHSAHGAAFLLVFGTLEDALEVFVRDQTLYKIAHIKVIKLQRH
jgi:hypothetical protein